MSNSVFAVAKSAIGLDINQHTGAHPRIGVLDVVPFVSLRRDERGRIADGPIADAISARDGFMRFAAQELSLPCFAYGPQRSLPQIRRDAFRTLVPDIGPSSPHRTAGACAVGARPILVAYNLWLSDPDLALAKTIAKTVRSAHVRALGIRVGPSVQVSCNLITPFTTGPQHVYDEIAVLAESAGRAIERAELVGLVPQAVLENIPQHRWDELDLDAERTIEVRLDG